MNLHQNARLTPHGREWIVRLAQSGQTAQAIAAAVGVCPRTVRKWIERFRTEGLAGLADRSSRPHRLHRPTLAEVIERIEALRRQRWTGKQIAQVTGVSPATVSRVLKRLGLSRMRDLQPREPIRRYEREYPGELIHLDIKKLGRFERVGHRITGDRTRQSSTRGRRQGQSWGVGWEYAHVCIDDASRIAFSQILPDEKKESAVAFLKAALDYYATLGITVARVMTDNGGCYKSFAFRDLCRERGLRHIRTSPIPLRPTARLSASSRPL
jgi:transposase